MSDNLTSIPNPPARPKRPDESHKGTFGTVVVIGGSATMLGAPALAAGSALRMGCGLAQLAVPRDILAHCLTIEPSATGHALDGEDGEACRELLTHLGSETVLAVGPGMGRGRIQRKWLASLLKHERPVVLDADGLNNLADLTDPMLSCNHAGPMVMTPHPGEFRRLADLHRVTADPTDPEQRPTAAAELAEACRAVVVLKGRHTLVTDAKQVYVNQTGNPALATAGTGDVLTGAIAGLIAQGMSSFDAAVLGVHVHGRAADRWAERVGPVGLTARTLADLLPEALMEAR